MDHVSRRSFYTLPFPYRNQRCDGLGARVNAIMRHMSLFMGQCVSSPVCPKVFATPLADRVCSLAGLGPSWIFKFRRFKYSIDPVTCTVDRAPPVLPARGGLQGGLPLRNKHGP